MCMRYINDRTYVMTSNHCSFSMRPGRRKREFPATDLRFDLREHVQKESCKTTHWNIRIPHMRIDR